MTPTPPAAPGSARPRRAPRPQAPGGGGTPPELLELDAGAPAHGGFCVARKDDDPTGVVVLVRHCLPGERVRARVTARASRVWYAEAVEVLRASPDRVSPVWAEAGPGGVGGGELSHVALGAQRTWKRWVLADCLRRIGGGDVVQAVEALPGAAPGQAVAVEALPSELAAQASDDPRTRARAGTRTRTRVSLEVTAQGRAGMHGFRSGQVLEVRQLPLAVAPIQQLGLTQDRRWRHHYRPGARLTAVAPSTGEPLVVVGEEVLTARARPTGRRRVTEVVDATALGLGELRYQVHVGGFWQVHRDAPRVLTERVVRAVVEDHPTAAGGHPGPGALRADGLRVLELYSGSGLLTLPLAALGARVTCLEGSAQAVADARRNLHDHPDARLVTGAVTADSVTELGSSFGPGRGWGADVVVLDPPRRGAGRQVVEAVAALGPSRVVLVACDPAALARDLAAFLGLGFRLGDLAALDMFPHTHHLEAVAVLERA